MKQEQQIKISFTNKLETLSVTIKFETFVFLSAI
jgi:hypothetical protein